MEDPDVEQGLVENGDPAEEEDDREDEGEFG